jgi:hypothetical protein
MKRQATVASAIRTLLSEGWIVSQSETERYSYIASKCGVPWWILVCPNGWLALIKEIRIERLGVEGLVVPTIHAALKIAEGEAVGK